MGALPDTAGRFKYARPRYPLRAFFACRRHFFFPGERCSRAFSLFFLDRRNSPSSLSDRRRPLKEMTSFVPPRVGTEDLAVFRKRRRPFFLPILALKASSFFCSQRENALQPLSPGILPFPFRSIVSSFLSFREDSSGSSRAPLFPGARCSSFPPHLIRVMSFPCTGRSAVPFNASEGCRSFEAFFFSRTIFSTTVGLFLPPFAAFSSFALDASTFDPPSRGAPFSVVKTLRSLVLYKRVLFLFIFSK